MSSTFSSPLGIAWAQRYLDHLARATDRRVLLAIAARFNRAGATWPSIRQIIEDMGGGFSHGQVLRAVNHCDEIGLLRITDRWSGGHKPMTYTAVGWTAAGSICESADSPSESLHGTKEGRLQSSLEDSSPPEDSSSLEDSGVVHRRTPASRARVVVPTSCTGISDTNIQSTGSGRRQESKKDKGRARGHARDAAPVFLNEAHADSRTPEQTTQPERATQPEQALQPEVDGRAPAEPSTTTANEIPSDQPAAPKVTPQDMIDVWNEVMAGSPIPQATMTARRAGALPRIMSHHFLKGRLHAWCRYLDCVVKDRMLRGERPGGHPTTIDQVATVGMIERVDAMRAARRYDHGIEGAEEPEILRHPDEPEMVAGVLFDKNGKAAGPDPEENRRINDTLAMALEQMRLSGNLVES